MVETFKLTHSKYLRLGILTKRDYLNDEKMLQSNEDNMYDSIYVWVNAKEKRKENLDLQEVISNET